MNILSPSAPKRNINLFAALTISLALTLLGLPNQAPAQEAVVPPQSASNNILVSGKLSCVLKRPVIVPFFGLVTDLPVRAGQKVARGEPLVRYRLLPESVLNIRSRLFPKELKELEMHQIRLAAKLTELEKKRDGLRELARENLTSEQSLEQIESEIRTTCKEKTSIADRLKWARQLHNDDLAVLTKQLNSPGGVHQIPEEVKLVSPLDGYVIWINSDIRVGAEIKPQEPAFLIGDLDTMIIKAQVHELEAMQLRLGDQAEVQVVSLPDKKFTGKVTRISWSSLTSAPDQPSFFEVEFSVSNPEHILKDGLKVRVTIPKAPTS